ncbi:H-NS histone family protein [Paraburkholderia guartelaensis]|uniref:H-NS histone family protein n=1 Tax=Paraburkholderia guartelaensis TaxID=2546446 RepID=UPI0038797AA7
MSSYKELREQLAMLDLKIAEVFKHEREIVIQEIRRKLELHQLTVDDVRGRSCQLTAKIRDPKTGRVWSGRGRKPSWVDAARSEENLPPTRQESTF